MTIFTAIRVVALGLLGAGPACSQALPFPLDPLLANQQVRSVGVAAGPDLALVLKPFPDSFGNAVIYRKVAGTWTFEFPLSVTGGIGAVNKTPGADEIAVGSFKVIKTYHKSGGLWNFGSQVTLTGGVFLSDFDLDGNLLAVLVHPDIASLGGLVSGSVRVFERPGLGGAWTQVSEINLYPSGSMLSVIESIALEGTRLAIGSSNLNLLRIYQRDFGGAGAWGNIATIVGDVRGHEALGSAVALDGDRLAATAGAVGRRDTAIETFSKDTGGTDTWGDTGTLLTAPPGGSIYGFQLSADAGRLAVLGLPQDAALGFFDPFRGNSQLWIFGPGATPSGYQLEQNRTVGAFNNGLFSGEFLSLCGDDLLLGLTPQNYIGSAQWAVSAYARNAGGSNKWGLDQFIEGPGAAGELGSAVDMHGIHLIAGIPGDDEGGADAGSAMLWLNAGLLGRELWFPAVRLENPDPNPGARFGEEVAILGFGSSGGGTIVAVGAPGHLGGRGGVWIMETSLFNQSPPFLVVPPVFPDPGDQYGAAVAGIDDLLVVGAPGDDDAGADTGALYIFERDLGGTDNWGLRVKLLRPAGSAGTGFGGALGMGGSEGEFSAGDPFIAAATPGTPTSSGKLFLFGRNTGGSENWGSLTGFSPPPGSPNGFGSAIDVKAGSVLVGAPDDGTTPGKAFYFRNDPVSGWGLFQTVGGTAGDGPSFGSAVALAEGLVPGIPNRSIVVGAPDRGPGGSFAAYGYRGAGGTDWGFLALQDGSAGDQLGAAVAASLIYFAGGAPGSGALATGGGAVCAFRAGCYEIWAHAQGPAFASAWFPEQDADGDYDTNLLEFAVDADPLDPLDQASLSMPLGTYTGSGGPVPALYWDEPVLPYCADFLATELDHSTDLLSWIAAMHESDPGIPGRRFFPLAGPRGFYRFGASYPILPSGGGRRFVLVESF